MTAGHEPRVVRLDGESRIALTEQEYEGWSPPGANWARMSPA